MGEEEEGCLGEEEEECLGEEEEECLGEEEEECLGEDCASPTEYDHGVHQVAELQGLLHTASTHQVSLQQEKEVLVHKLSEVGSHLIPPPSFLSLTTLLPSHPHPQHKTAGLQQRLTEAEG